MTYLYPDAKIFKVADIQWTDGNYPGGTLATKAGATIQVGAAIGTTSNSRKNTQGYMRVIFREGGSNGPIAAQVDVGPFVVTGVTNSGTWAGASWRYATLSGLKTNTRYFGVIQTRYANGTEWYQPEAFNIWTNRSPERPVLLEPNEQAVWRRDQGRSRMRRTTSCNWSRLLPSGSGQERHWAP